MSQYLEALRQAMVIYPMIVVLFTVPYIAWSYHKYGSVLSLRVLVVYSFLLYLLCVYCLVILPLPTPEKAAALHGHKAQLIPFSFLADIVKQAEIQPGQPASWLHIFTGSAFWTTIFNLFMTMPFGIYLRYYFCYHWRKTLRLSFLLSLFFELTQLSGLYFVYPGSYRLFDVDDLIVNTAGSMIGFALAGPVSCLLPTRQELDTVSFQRGASISFTRRVFCLSGRYGLPDLCIRYSGRSCGLVWNHSLHSMDAGSIYCLLWAAAHFTPRSDARQAADPHENRTKE